MKMGDDEKEKFREHIKRFTIDNIAGWLSAIGFILPMKEVNEKLENKLRIMYDICDDVFEEKER